MKRSTCCQALPHNIYPTHCADCGEYADWFEEDEEEYQPTEKDRLEIELAALELCIAPGLKALDNLIYSSTRLQHAAAEAGDGPLLIRHTDRLDAFREARTALLDALGLGTGEDKDSAV